MLFSRRQFNLSLALASLSCTVATRAHAEPAHVSEADETAQALAYRQDSSKVDSKKFPHHAAMQRCSNCSFWQGKPDDAWAGCAMFGRKHIAHTGWCQAWTPLPG
ncbi:high-potential iron-sulfur protein [Paucibacter sp. hw1]|uniref:High-potential iron-sulfur protein n=1 Tax=Roseateles koreensis TaxID=2987526 RepID=A0ABT5KXP6_9BURK|nr:high-potential iron-sulfur protein [Roseateles koreensis]